MTGRWSPGDQIMVRSLWDGQVRAAWPDTVVSDTEHLLALYLASGTRVKRADNRMPVGDRSMVDDVWTSDMLLLVAPDDSHSVLLFWEGADRVLDRWYVNLQSPVKRTDFGIDFMDHFLDIIVSADLSTWRWKDEDHFARIQELGWITPDEAAAIRAEGEMIIDRMRTKAPPFSESWPTWRPDPAWPIPHYPMNGRGFPKGRLIGL